MATKAERARRRAANKLAWRNGERWNAGDGLAALTPRDEGITGVGNSDLQDNVFIRTDNSEPQATLANGNGRGRNNAWQSAPRGDRFVSRAARVEPGLPGAGEP